MRLYGDFQNCQNGQKWPDKVTRAHKLLVRRGPEKDQIVQGRRIVCVRESNAAEIARALRATHAATNLPNGVSQQRGDGKRRGIWLGDWRCCTWRVRRPIGVKSD